MNETITTFGIFDMTGMSFLIAFGIMGMMILFGYILKRFIEPDTSEDGRFTEYNDRKDHK